MVRLGKDKVNLGYDRLSKIRLHYVRLGYVRLGLWLGYDKLRFGYVKVKARLG